MFKGTVKDLHFPLPALTERYRAACSEDLALVSTFLRHPCAGRQSNHGALDHTFSLPDGHRVTVRTSRVKIPRSLIDRLSRDYAEYLLLKEEPMFIFSVSVKVKTATEVVDLSGGKGNRTELANRRRARSVVEAMHRRMDAQRIHEDGTVPSVPGYRFSWVGTRDGRPLPSPEALFSPRPYAA